MNIHFQRRGSKRVVGKKSDKRNDILQTALELIAEQGFHGAPMAMIAERSRVAVGTIYRYFENKDVLINELYNDLEEKIVEFLKKGYSVKKPFRERFLHLGGALLRYFIAYPLHFRFIEQYHNSPYGVSLRRDRLIGKAGDHAVFTDLFAEGVAQQVLKDMPFPVLFALSVGPLVPLARDHILGFVVLDASLISRVIEACWDCVKR
jgi:AcrR family transcriptional regulator